MYAYSAALVETDDQTDGSVTISKKDDENQAAKPSKEAKADADDSSENLSIAEEILTQGKQSAPDSKKTNFLDDESD